LPEFPDDRDPWWRVLKIKPYATEYEIHTAYEKLLEKSHPKKKGRVSARTLKERARKAARLQQAYEDALESLKRRE
jgi:DnaJ-domain-containing protein 1